jgi:hypothetical protein
MGGRVPPSIVECGKEIASARTTLRAAALLTTFTKWRVAGITPPKITTRTAGPGPRPQTTGKGECEEDQADRASQAAKDAEAKKQLVSGDVVGRCGRVSGPEQFVGNVDEAQRAGHNEEQTPESGDSPGLGTCSFPCCKDPSRSI